MLNVIAEILFIALGASSFANFFDDCLEEGEIFDFYGRWVKKEMRWNNDVDEEKIIQEKIPVPKWKKPIGGCIVCTNTWITIFFVSSFLLHHIFQFDYLYAFVLFLCTIGISNTFLKFIIK